MLYSAIEEMSNLLDAQLNLFINVNITMELYYRGGNNIYPIDVSLAISDVNQTRNEMYVRQDKYNRWRESVERKRRMASDRLRRRLARADETTRPYNPNALGHTFRKMSCHTAIRHPFTPLAEAVRATIKADRAGDRAGQRAGKQRLIELAYESEYTSLVHEVMGKHWPSLRLAHNIAQTRFDTGHWKKPVWWECSFADRYPTHLVHASRETPGNVAFYADTDKMEADKLTSMKAGRYLAAFYGDILNDEEIKQWANKQLASTTPAELKLIGNDDPLGWVWVYENSTASCMRYNRSNRYINLGLKGDRHPVTVYAHPENNLALAYTMLPGEVEDRMRNCCQDEHVVGARTIVNKESETYLRIYAAGDVQYTAMKEALERAGYTQSNDTLRHEKLRLVEVESGYLCPYLDGDYVYVSVRSSHLLVGEDGLPAHETSGYVSDEDEDEDEYEDEDRCYCSYCETTNNEEAGTFVESVSEWVCDDCISEQFVWAAGRYGTRSLYRPEDECVAYCEHDGCYYVTDYLSDHGMGMAEDGEVYPEDQLVATASGVYHMDDAVELTYAFDDYGWALRDRAYHLPNGETCHVDDADKIAEIEVLEQEAA